MKQWSISFSWQIFHELSSFIEGNRSFGLGSSNEFIETFAASPFLHQKCCPRFVLLYIKMNELSHQEKSQIKHKDTLIFCWTTWNLSIILTTILQYSKLWMKYFWFLEYILKTNRKKTFNSESLVFVTYCVNFSSL